MRKIIFTLQNKDIIKPDRDYPHHYRVIGINDLPADDIVCLIDRFCHISHLSAMQRWGLSDRNPHALIVTRPDDKTIADMIVHIMEAEEKKIPWKNQSRDWLPRSFRLNNIAHPHFVRERTIKIYKTRIASQSIQDRFEFARISTIGQTFIDMLHQPALCGGMDHVLKIWDEYAQSHLNSIIITVNAAKPIIKCRAGYILEERLKITDSRLETWKCCAQRGGSRVLDPNRPYVPIWSETWMISLNV